MSHRSDHIIISGGRNTVSFGDPHLPPPVSKIRVWHIGVALLVVGMIIGGLFF